MMIPDEDGPELKHVDTSLAGVTNFFLGVLMIFWFLDLGYYILVISVVDAMHLIWYTQLEPRQAGWWKFREREEAIKTRERL